MRVVGFLPALALFALVVASFAAAACSVSAPSSASAGSPVRINVSSSASPCYWVYFCDVGDAVSAPQAPSSTFFYCMYAEGVHVPSVRYYWGLDCDFMTFFDLCEDSVSVTGVDNRPPVITLLTPSVSKTGATLRWATDESAKCFLEYGRTTAYGSRVDLAGFFRTHWVDVAGLSASMLYHYRVSCTDVGGLSSSTKDASFVTLSLQKTPYSKVAPAIGLAPSSAFEWDSFLVGLVSAFAVLAAGLMFYLFRINKTV
ncbi:TPA: hypothetical protein HA318_04635 [Candidatus Micrarchaeota archaeon]|nr:hypothetical protein [Candidatus Micrarchaeota archaeon]